MKPSLLLFIVLLSACASPVWRLHPVSDKIRWDQGNALVSKSNDGLTATLHYIRHNGNSMVLDLELVNESDQPMFIDPKAIHMYTFTSHPESITSNIGSTFFATDPEQQLIDIEKTMSRETNSYAAGLILNAAVDLTSSENDRISNSIDRQTAASDFDQRLASLDAQHNAWRNMALRKTDLGPGQVVNGFIQIPFDPKSSYYRVVVPYGDRPFEFVFQQLKH
jgi:hypothetical protein